MEPSTTDPYAPPKSTSTGTNNTTYLEHDGYAFRNELVANQHFKSPLICAKLGIHIPAESNPVPKEITVTRIPRISKFIISLCAFLGFVLLISFIAWARLGDPMGIIILYVLLLFAIRRILTKRYKIPFYISEHYTRTRTKSALIFLVSLIILLIICIFGIITNNDEYTFIPIPLAIVALFIYNYKTALFTVIQTKGDYHYIHGVHQNLLDKLPHLPLSS